MQPFDGHAWRGLVGLFFFFLLLELLFPLRQRTHARMQRFRVNGGLAGLTFLVAGSVVHPVARPILA